jgi:hypothetical protein
MSEVINVVVPPSAALKQQYDDATLSGDIGAVKRLAPIATGTSLEGDIKNSVGVMERSSAPIRQIVDAANQAGGAGTPKGNIAAANEWKAVQPPVGIWKQIAAGLMGVPDAWKMGTTGRQETTIEYDKFGRGAITFYNQNNPKTPAFVIDSDTKQPLTPAEYTERGFGLYKDPSSSPFAQGVGDVYKKNSAALQASATRTNQAAAAYQDIGEKSKKAEAIWTSLAENFGLSNKTLNEIHSLSGKVMSTETAISDAVSQMTQGMTTDSRRKGAENLRALTGNAGIPEIVGINAKGQFVGADSKSYTAQDLAQMTQDFMKRNGLQSQYTQAKAELIKSALYQSLPLEAKTQLELGLDLTQAVHTRMNELRSSEIGELPFLTNNIPYRPGDPYQVAIIGSVFNQANTEKALAFADFFAKEAAKYPANRPPPAGAIEAAFTRSDVMREINERYEKRIKDVESKRYPEGPSQSESVTTPAVAGTPIQITPKPKSESVKSRSIKSKPEKKSGNHADAFLNSFTKK